LLCEQCQQGYYLGNEKYPNRCTKQCDQQKTPFFLNNDENRCDGCGSGCQRCTNSTGHCETCNQGYIF
jgi:hypothetical protein